MLGPWRWMLLVLRAPGSRRPHRGAHRQRRQVVIGRDPRIVRRRRASDDKPHHADTPHGAKVRTRRGIAGSPRRAYGLTGRRSGRTSIAEPVADLVEPGGDVEVGGEAFALEPEPWCRLGPADLDTVWRRIPRSASVPVPTAQRWPGGNRARHHRHRGALAAAAAGDPVGRPVRQQVRGPPASRASRSPHVADVPPLGQRRGRTRQCQPDRTKTRPKG